MNIGPTLAVLLLAIPLAGCGPGEVAVADSRLIEVPTQAPAPPGPLACPAALAIGTLVADPRWGIALRSAGAAGVITRVVWPHGYVGRRNGTSIELLDGGGRVVGVVGDSIELGGGLGEDDSFYPCG